MGKNPTEVKKSKGKTDPNEPKNTLIISYYTKSNGNTGMKKRFEKRIAAK